MTFASEARAAAVAWKQQSELPDLAKVSAPYGTRTDPVYPFCLPVEYAEHNLLDEARAVALDAFADGEIHWHDGVNGGPSNHLLDSQVQCVNALAPCVRDEARVRQVFGAVLDIAEVLPFIAEGANSDFVVFEWIGAHDYLSERARGRGHRGANTTSADAAIRFRTSRGTVELALIEWKYTERYLGHELSGDERSMAVRHDRYRALYDDLDGPIRHDVIPYEDLFVEPFYQLFRLALLADQMERAGEQGAERVRLVYVAPARNAELWGSLNRDSHRELAARLVDESDPHPVMAVWSALCLRPDRFVYLDSAAFVAPVGPTSAEFRSRYGHVAGDEPPSARKHEVVEVPLDAAHEPPWTDLSWDGPWAAWLSLAWVAAAGGEGTHPIPEPPDVNTSYESFVGPPAWWTPLPHLLGYSFGWTDYARGLFAWRELGCPIDDARFELIDRWWGAAAIGFACWIDARRGDAEAQARLDLLGRSQQDAGNMEIVSMLSALCEGGSDPLHLTVHAPIPPIEAGNDVPDGTSGARLLLGDTASEAVLVVESYEGWYERLTRIGHDLAAKRADGQRHVDVLCRAVGWMGRYRQSPVTGRWFAGSHRLHLFGA